MIRKFAVLSDIHSNLIALKAVLKHSQAQGITEYIVAGDHITDCSHPKEVLDILMTIKGHIIAGNREKTVLSLLKSPTRDIRQMDSMIWTGNQLEAKHLEWLENMPIDMTIELDDTEPIRVVHGSPNDVYEHIRLSDTDLLKDISARLEEKVLICGHTHEQWDLRMNDKLIVNPGSVGISNKSCEATYSVLIWEDEWQVEHYQISYDFEELKQAFIASGIMAIGIWPKLILESIQFGKCLYGDFVKEAYQEARDKGYQDFYIPNHIWNKKSEAYNDQLSRGK